MRDTPAALNTHMGLGTTTLAYIVKLTRRDGVALYVALDHDEPIPYDGHVYHPIYGLIPTEIATSSALDVDNLEAKGALLALGVDESSIAAGLWNLCDVRLMRINWRDTSMGVEKCKRGYFGQISQDIGENTFNAEVRGITQKLQSVFGSLLSPLCDADFGDARCQKVLVEGTHLFTAKAITSIVTDQRQFICSSLAGVTAGEFVSGKVTWTAGDNAGLSKEIKGHTAGGNIELTEPMPYAFAIGDVGTFTVGCRKNAVPDCTVRFDNYPNFKGFDKAPGTDQLYRGVPQ